MGRAFYERKLMADYLSETQKHIFAMSEHKRLRQKIFVNITNQYYSKNSQVHFYDGPSQRLAYVLCQQPIKVGDLKRFEIKIDNTNVKIGDVTIYCTGPFIAIQQIQDIDFIMKTRKENEIKREQLKNPQPELPTGADLTIGQWKE